VTICTIACFIDGALEGFGDTLLSAGYPSIVAGEFNSAGITEDISSTWCILRRSSDRRHVPCTLSFVTALQHVASQPISTASGNRWSRVCLASRPAISDNAANLAPGAKGINGG
jgi:hypothetical protein